MNQPALPEITLDVSIVIPAYKRSALLHKAVNSALAQDMAQERFEVIVVDSSPDQENARLVENLMRENPTAQLRLERKTAEGPGPSRLLGAHRARGGIIAFLDSDCQATPGWLAAGLAGFSANTGIVQGRTLPVPGQPIGVFCRYVRVEAENPRYEAANIFYRRECLAGMREASRDLTPNDERPTGGEDALMAWRVKRAGWQSCFAEAALVYHEVLQISVWQWFYEKRLVMLPWLVREVPEIKTVFYLRYFHDRAHACLLLLLLGAALSPWSSAWLAAGLPYAALRASEPSNSLRGVKRLLRVLVYFPRDLLSFGLLVLGSLRYRSLLL